MRVGDLANRVVSRDYDVRRLAIAPTDLVDIRRGLIGSCVAAKSQKPKEASLVTNPRPRLKRLRAPSCLPARPRARLAGLRKRLGAKSLEVAPHAKNWAKDVRDIKGFKDRKGRKDAKDGKDAKGRKS